MTSKPEQSVDERLIDARDLALAALHEITPADTVGPPAGYTAEDDGAVSLRFHTRLSGYPGWFWTVSVAVVDGADPTVLEVELLPGDGALLAPDWVPWATRLAEYQAAQVVAATVDDDDDLDDDDDTDDESDDDDDEPKARFHAGDLDGVDIDELDADHPDETDDDPDEADDDPDEADDDPDEDDDDPDEDDDDPDEDDDDEADDSESDRFDEDDDEGDRSY